MSKISQKTRESLMNEINSILYYEAPIKGMFTKQIADKLIRDKEFIRDLLLEMERRGWIKKLGINKRNYEYIKRRKWILSDNIKKLFDEDKLR